MEQVWETITGDLRLALNALAKHYGLIHMHAA
jgi:hypothetical protein